MLQPSKHLGKHLLSSCVMGLELGVLGVGAGSTCTLYSEASSSFMICLDGDPVLMLDVVRKAHLLQHIKLL
jgi:hypothetical protein